MKNEKLLNYALKVLTQGKISVIPVGANKIPLIPWKKYQDEFATEQDIHNWFEKYPDMQLGFVTGKISLLSYIRHPDDLIIATAFNCIMTFVPVS